MANVALLGGQLNQRLLHGPTIPAPQGTTPELLEGYARETRISAETVAKELYFGGKTDADKLAALQYLAAKFGGSRTPRNECTLGVVESYTQNQDVFLDALGHPKVEIRRVALEALAQTGNLKELDAIANLKSDPDPDLRRAALKLAMTITLELETRANIHRMRTSDGPWTFQARPGYALMSRLTELAGDHDPEVRSAAKAMLDDRRFAIALVRIAPVDRDNPAYGALVEQIAAVPGTDLKGHLEALYAQKDWVTSSSERDTVGDLLFRRFDVHSTEIVERLVTSFSRFFGGAEATVGLLEQKQVRTDGYLKRLLENSYTLGSSYHSPVAGTFEALHRWEQELGSAAFDQKLVEILDNALVNEHRYAGTRPRASAVEIGAIEYLRSQNRLGPVLERVVTQERFRGYYLDSGRYEGKSLYKKLVQDGLASLDEATRAAFVEKHARPLQAAGLAVALPKPTYATEATPVPQTRGPQWLATVRQMFIR